MPNCHVTAFADFLTRSHRELFASCRGRSLDRGRFSQALLAAILMAGIVVALPAQVHPGLHFAELGKRHLPVDLDQTRALAFGDVDGDGDLDLVVGNGHGQQNRLHMNLQRQLDAAHLLRAGQPYTLDVYSRAGLSNASDLAFPYLSTTRRSIPVRPYGTLGIDPMAPLPLVLIPQPAGIGSVTWTVPNNPAFAGVEVFAQALLIQALTDLRLTNVTADVVLR